MLGLKGACDFMKGFFIFFIFFISVIVQAQIVGTVYNENKEVLPFASVYLENSTKGTIANSEGEFELGLEPGDYKLVFQYTGYIKHFENIHYTGERVELKIILKESKFNLGEIVFSAKREDPAYDIIRKAILERKLIERYSKDYSCNVSVLGTAYCA